MSITFSNQRPTTLSPFYTDDVAQGFTPLDSLAEIIVKPLFNPLNAASPVQCVDSNNQDATSTLPDIFTDCLGDVINPAAEQTAREILSQTLINFDNTVTLPFEEVFTAQAALRTRSPFPSRTVLYSTQHDVIPAAKKLLAKNTGTYAESVENADTLLTALAFSVMPQTLGFWFESDAVFAQFATWLSQHIAQAQTTYPADTVALLQQVTQLQCKDLTESLLLRKDTTDGNDPLSFPRLLSALLQQFMYEHNHNAAVTNTPLEAGILPFSVSELLCPIAIVFVNVEAHARSNAPRIEREWKLIQASLTSPIRVLSVRKLSQLTALPRAAQQAARQAAAAKQPNQQTGPQRGAAVTFRSKPPKPIDLYTDIARIIKHMGKVNKSQNVFTTTKSSFSKPSRRDPNDFNRPGKSTSKQYMPDIHLFLDTSGSISEENYRDSVIMLIDIARKLNVNIYVTTFSDVIAQPVLLKTHAKSKIQIWREFKKIVPVTGGTDFSLVWDFINETATRKRRLSLMITDFEWSPGSRRVEHPKNLYYAPCSNFSWQRLVRSAEGFAQSMMHIDPDVKLKMLGMTNK